MAIDFSQVKSLTIPEGSVKKITDSNGNILWKEKTAEWHTIWQGNVKSYNDTSGKKVAHLDALSGTVTLRVTWSCSASGGSGWDITTKYYNNNGSTTTTTRPDSPFQFDLDTASPRSYIVGCTRIEKHSRYGRKCYLSWNPADKLFRLVGGVGNIDASDIDLSMTVTRIEQYY